MATMPRNGISHPLARDRVHRGDCLDLLARVPTGTVDLAFADPPFNIGYEYDTYHDDRPADDYLAWSRRWMAEIVRVLKSAGTFWLAIGDEYAAELKVLFSRSHAHLFHFVKDPAKFTFNVDAIRVPSARELVYGDRRADARGRLPDDTWILRPQDLPAGFSADDDTWYFPRVCGTFKERSGWHGCQMPEQLLGRIIRACSDPGEVVLDPFGGSGTTLAVAKKLGRSFIGLELSTAYATRIDERLAGIAVGDPLDGAPEPLKSCPATKDGRRLDRRTPRRRIVKKPAGRKPPTLF
jgi:DNA modification methylase